MSFYLHKEWIDQEDGIEHVFIHYAVSLLGAMPDWSRNAQTRELIPEGECNRKRRGKVIKLPRQLDGQENYHLHYFFRVDKGFRELTTKVFVEEIVADGSLTFIDYGGHYTNVCLYWSINGWRAPNYSTMFEDGTSLDHPLSSLHFYGRAHDGTYVYERFKWLQSISPPHIYRGKVHGPRSARVAHCYHIMRRGSPLGDDYNFWDNNDGLNYWRELR